MIMCNRLFCASHSFAGALSASSQGRGESVLLFSFTRRDKQHETLRTDERKSASRPEYEDELAA